jgi:hypothetical protein
MRRLIKARPQETGVYQALIDHKLATLNVILSQVPDISTFAQLGELIGYSHEWVRQRLVRARRAETRCGISCFPDPSVGLLGQWLGGGTAG